MSDIDLTGATEAAAVAMVPFVMQQEWSDVSAEAQREAISVARLAITAAAPLIEAAVREQVAREIEQTLRLGVSGPLDAIGAPAPVLGVVNDLTAAAARIARGGVR